MTRAKLTREQILEKRVVKSTRTNYKSSIKKMINWLNEKHPDAVHIVDGVTMMKIPLPNEDVIIDFLTDNQFIQEKDESDNTVQKLMAFSTMNGMRSAIVDLYKENKVTLSGKTLTELTNFMSGYKRTTQEAKQNGELPIFEGKRNISYSGYKALALEVLKMQGNVDSSLYVHPFIVLSWNLFARSNSVANLMLHHFDWKEDAMLITLPKHKGDQEGLHVYPKHIYANPTYPELCPILSLGIYLFSTNHFTREGSEWRLFHGNKVESKFSHWLKRLLDQELPELGELNNIKNEIGTHSFRKGVVTYVLSFPCGPSVVAAFLRACWSLGAVQQRYIFEGEGSDQFLGRVACGLPFGEIEFQSLPPRFDPAFVIEESTWKKIYPNFNQQTMPKGFQDCLRYILASVVYHSAWLQQTLNQSNPLFHSPLWTSTFIQESRGFILVGTKRCDKTNLVATGIPPMIDMKYDINHLKDCLKFLYEALQSNSHALEETIKGSIEALPSSLGSYLLRNFQIEGAVPITIDQFHRFREELRSDVSHEIRKVLKDERLQERPNLEENARLSAQFPYESFCWGGRFHPVPEDFKFQKLNLRTLWNLWHNGNSSLKIAPYKHISQKFDLKTEKERNLFSKAKGCIEMIYSSCKLISGSESVGQDEMFECGLNKLINLIEERKRSANESVYVFRRYGEISFTTLYKDLKYVK